MRKFLSLLGKELHELINKQMIITCVFMLFFMSFMGQTMNTATENLISDTIYVTDLNQSALSAEAMEYLRKYFNVEEPAVTSVEEMQTYLTENDISQAFILNSDFDSSISEGKSASLTCISYLKSASMFAGFSDQSGTVIDSLNSFIQEKLMMNAGDYENADFVNHPVVLTEHTIANGKIAQVSASDVQTSLILQSMIIPILIMVLVLFSSQTIISAMASEKLDKTLETLFSTPISRLSIIFAKMLAATLVALINAVVYMVGFGVMMSRGMSDIATETTSSVSVTEELLSVSKAISELGLSMNTGSVLLIGGQLFLSILIALTISIILGTFATDAKSAQSLTLPIILMTMIPYMITMFLDVNTLPAIGQILVKAIPFTHTFTAMSDILFGHMNHYWFGLIYQIIFFILCLFFTIRLFSSDRMFTSENRLLKKKAFGKKI